MWLVSGPFHEVLARAEQLVDLYPVQAVELLQGHHDRRIEGDALARAILARAANLLGDEASCLGHARAVLGTPDASVHARAVAAEALGACILYHGGDITAAVHSLDDSIAIVGPIEGSRIIARLAQIHLFRLDVAAMNQTVRLVVGLTLPANARLRIGACRALLVAHTGRTSLALSLSEALPGLAASSFPVAPLESLEALYMTSFIRLFAGDLAGAQELITILSSLPTDRLGSLIDLVGGMVAFEGGDLEAAAEMFERSIAVGHSRTTGFLPMIAAAVHAQVLAELGRPGAAAASLGRIPEKLHHELPVVAPFVVQAKAAVLAADGKHDAATRLLVRHAAHSFARHINLEALRSLHLAHRLGAEWNQLVIVERVRVDGPLPTAMLEHLLALRDRDAGRLDAVTARFARMGMPQRAAGARADANAVRR